MATRERSWLERIRNRARRGEGTTAFVLSGGGNLGAIQVGMLRALIEADVRPDVVLGCSVGALNGAALAQDPTLTGVARLEDLWRGLAAKEAAKEVMPPSGWLPGTVALARKGEAVHDNEGVRRLLEGMLTATTFEELTVRFQCVATDMAGVREVWFSEGPLIDAILASSAIPALYPAVHIDGVQYHDGAIVNDVPMTRAVDLGARTICVLQVGAFERPRREPRRPLDVAIQAYWVARHHRFKRDLANMPAGVDVLVLPTGQPGLFRYNDFSHSGDLMTAAHDATRAFLAERTGRSIAATAMPYATTEPDAEARDVRRDERAAP
jgi:NTE family protein